jgi:hypothetical protein
MSKTVKITENELVDLIDKIVNETVTEKKKQWIAEQKAKNKNIVKENTISPEESLGSVDLTLQDLIFINISLESYPFEKSSRFLQTVKKIHSLLNKKEK